MNPLTDLDSHLLAVHSWDDYQLRSITVIIMPEAHKSAYRHPKYKTAYRVNSWAEYDKALRDRGDITLWISQDTIDAWTPPQTGNRGAQPVYSELAIETALTLPATLSPSPAPD